jgi:hypothetical protein
VNANAFVAVVAVGAVAVTCDTLAQCHDQHSDNNDYRHHYAYTIIFEGGYKVHGIAVPIVA